MAPEARQGTGVASEAHATVVGLPELAAARGVTGLGAYQIPRSITR